MKHLFVSAASLFLMSAAPPVDAPIAAADAIATMHADIALLEAGDPYPADWQDSRWLKARAATTDADARDLFERIFREQSLMAMRPNLGDIARMEAFNKVAKPVLDASLRANEEWLKGVLKRIGWFDISRYGADASQAAWLIVQHADHDPSWQREILQMLASKVQSGDMQGRYYAYLVDRVAVNGGEPQVYGTQGGCVDGEWRLKEVADPVILDRLRSEAGLEPLEDYKKRFAGHCG